MRVLDSLAASGLTRELLVEYLYPHSVCFILFILLLLNTPPFTIFCVGTRLIEAYTLRGKTIRANLIGRFVK